jgi:hypothetical protein
MGGGRTCVGERRAVTLVMDTHFGRRVSERVAADRAGQVEDVLTTVSSALTMPGDQGLHVYIRLSIFQG